MAAISARTSRAYEQAVARLKHLRASKGRAPTEMVRVIRQLAPDRRVLAAQEIGLSRRTAYYLASIAEAIDAGLMTQQQVEALGWTKARSLAATALAKRRRITPAQVAQAQARTASRITRPAGSGSDRRHISFSLSREQASILRQALGRFGAPAGAGPRARAQALVEICRGVIQTRSI